MTQRFATLVVFTSLALAPAIAYAQAAITGVVRDTSGAVLPGVTVEASSPALIEKVRSAVTDGTGQYRIIDLRPGVYNVTFTLSGFSTFRREGIELTGSFTATVNAELRVGALEETITVSGDAPVVDVQSALRQQILDREVVAALPTGRSFQSLVRLEPAVITPETDVGGTQGPRSFRFTARGTLYSDSRQLLDGLGTASADGGGASGSFYVLNVAASQEVVTTTSGGLGEAETAGVIVNVVPREGGNAISGTFFGTGANGRMQGNNYTEALRDQGLEAPNALSRMWDFNGAFGGPVARDRLWYFFSARHAVADNFVAGMFHRRNFDDPNTWWTWEPDLTRQAINDTKWWSTAVRLTWQASARNKVGLFWDEQYRCDGCPGASPTSDPEGGSMGHAYPRVWQTTWTSPVSNRILLDAGVGEHYLRWAEGKRETPDQIEGAYRIDVTEQAGAIPGLTYDGGFEWPGFPLLHADLYRDRSSNHTYNWRTSFSYVTGTHNAKFGYRGSFYGYERLGTPRHGLSYRFNNGVPNQVTQSMAQAVEARMQSHGFYAQDQWSITPRLTLQGAARYDHWRSNFPARLQPRYPNFYVPDPFRIPETSGASFHDISPRLAAAYDLTGDGRTAVKLHLGQYMVGQESSDTGIFGSHMDPVRRLAVSANRSWTDANRNYMPDCDLRNPNANGECGALSNLNFGTDVPASAGGRGFSVNYDPEITGGWGVRPNSWEFAASVQRELLPRVSATLSYFRRWFGNFAIVHNTATTAADYTRFELPAPLDPRLPNSGGGVRGVATINPDKFGQVREEVAAAGKFGTRTDRSHGIDLTVNARMQNDLVLQGGMNFGSRLWDDCELAAQFPELAGPSALEINRPSGALPLEFCRIEQPRQLQVKFLATYMIPRVDVQVSATWQSTPGPEILANWDVPNATVASVIGRNLAGGARNQTVPLVAPLSMYGDRVDQIDFRVAKVLRFGATRTLVGVDLFNALNSSAVLSYTNTFGPRWLAPRGILEARLAKLSVQVDF